LGSLPESFSLVTDPTTLIPVERGGYLEGVGRSTLCEIVNSGSVSVPRSLAKELEEGWRYREEVKIVNPAGQREKRIPHVIQGEQVWVVATVTNLAKLERKLYESKELLRLLKDAGHEAGILVITEKQLKTEIEAADWSYSMLVTCVM
jgi:hypothetical protein